MTTIGEKIKKARRTANLTQKELGEACGLAEITIRNYEAGKYKPKYETLVKLSEVLKVKIDWLLGITPLIYSPADKKLARQSFLIDDLIAFLGFKIEAIESEGYLWIRDKRDDSTFELDNDELNMLQDSILSYTKYLLTEIRDRRKQEDRIKELETALARQRVEEEILIKELEVLREGNNNAT